METYHAASWSTPYNDCDRRAPHNRTKQHGPEDSLDRGGVQETRSAEPAQPVLAGCSLLQGKCEELAQNAPCCGCALETHCVSPHNMVVPRSSRRLSCSRHQTIHSTSTLRSRRWSSFAASACFHGRAGYGRGCPLP